MFAIEMLPAGHGDSLWIEYGEDPARPHRVLIDGGTGPTYDVLRAKIGALPEGARRFDLMAVTHIDADHIDGAVILLQELGQIGMRVNEVWFNGWQHINDESSPADVFGPEQGEFLGALIQRARLAWNIAFGAEAVVIPETGELPRVELPGGATVTLLTPQPRQLRRLRRNWHTVARDAGWVPGDAEAALARLKKRKNYEPPARLEVFGAEVFATDNSVANGSSIAFVLEHEGTRCLFAADAVPEVLTEGLRRFADERGADAAHFDLVKVPHHGAAKNMNEELARRLASKRYLISTSGARYRHPDRAAIQLILEQPTPDGRELYFNYKSETTMEWGDPSTQEKYGYHALFPDTGSQGITLVLAD
jgi:beta-lactamase superfamily II metal-dependent hydrolase